MVREGVRERRERERREANIRRGAVTVPETAAERSASIGAARRAGISEGEVARRVARGERIQDIGRAEQAAKAAAAKIQEKKVAEIKKAEAVKVAKALPKTLKPTRERIKTQEIRFRQEQSALQQRIADVAQSIKAAERRFRERGSELIEAERRKQEKETTEQTRARQRREKEKVIEEVARKTTKKLIEVGEISKKLEKKVTAPSPEFKAALDREQLYKEVQAREENVDILEQNIRALRDIATDPFLVGTQQRPGGIVSEKLQGKLIQNVKLEKKRLQAERSELQKARSELTKAAKLEREGIPAIEKLKTLRREFLPVGEAIISEFPEGIKGFTESIFEAVERPETVVAAVVKGGAAAPEILFTPPLTAVEVQRRARIGAAAGVFLFPPKAVIGKLPFVSEVKGKGKGKGVKDTGVAKEFVKIETVGDIVVLEEAKIVSRDVAKKKAVLEVEQQFITRIKEEKLKKKPTGVDVSPAVVKGERVTTLETPAGGIVKVSEADVVVKPEILDVTAKPKGKIARVRERFGISELSPEKVAEKKLEVIREKTKAVKAKAKEAGVEFGEKVGRPIPEELVLVRKRLEAGKPSDVAERRPLSVEGLETKLGLTPAISEKIKAEFLGLTTEPGVTIPKLTLLREDVAVIRKRKGLKGAIKKAQAAVKKRTEDLAEAPPSTPKELEGRPLRGGVELVSTGRVDPFGQPIQKLQPFTGKAGILAERAKKILKIESPFEVKFDPKKETFLQVGLKERKKKPKLPKPKRVEGEPVVIKKKTLFEFDLAEAPVDFGVTSAIKGGVAEKLTIPKEKPPVKKPPAAMKERQMRGERFDERFDVGDPAIQKELIADPEIFAALSERARETRAKEILQEIRKKELEQVVGSGQVAIVKEKPVKKVKEKLVSVTAVEKPVAKAVFPEVKPFITDKEAEAAAFVGERVELAPPPFDEVTQVPRPEVVEKVFGKEALTGRVDVKVTPGVRTVGRVESRLRATPELRVREKLKLREITKQKTITDVVGITEPIERLKPIQKITTTQIITTRQPPVTELVPRLTPPERPPPTRIRRFFFLRGARRKKKPVRRAAPGFQVLVKRKGKFERVTTKPVTKAEALGIGGLAVERTAAATFKIVATRRPAVRRKEPVRPFQPTRFRPAKKPKKGVFIEKTRFRIDTSGELEQITKKGLEERKRRRTKRLDAFLGLGRVEKQLITTTRKSKKKRSINKLQLF